MSDVTTSSERYPGESSQYSKIRKKKIKKVQGIRKEKTKLSFVNAMVTHAKNTKEPIDKL